MAALTGEEVINSLVTKIRAAFTTVQIAAIYQDKPRQGVVKPYVFLHPINTEHTNQMRGSALQDYMLAIRVHPLATCNDVQTWARGIALKLVDAINVITVSGQQVKSRTLTWNVQDDVLIVLVTYQYRVRVVPTVQTDMGTIEIKERVK